MRTTESARVHVCKLIDIDGRGEQSSRGGGIVAAADRATRTGGGLVSRNCWRHRGRRRLFACAIATLLLPASPPILLVPIPITAPFLFYLLREDINNIAATTIRRRGRGRLVVCGYVVGWTDGPDARRTGPRRIRKRASKRRRTTRHRCFLVLGRGSQERRMRCAFHDFRPLCTPINMDTWSRHHLLLKHYDHILLTEHITI